MPNQPAETHVWARDSRTGHAGPVARAAIEADKNRYKPDEKHPVRDGRGQLLPWKPHADKAAAPNTDPQKEATK